MANIVLFSGTNSSIRDPYLLQEYDCFLGKKVLSGIFEGTSPLKFAGESKYEGKWEVAIRAAVDKAQSAGLMLLPDAKVVGCHVKLETSAETGAHTLSFECAVAEQAIR
ncbi:hypothetical protein GCK32_005899 [Trichostrongylus colubriformis]|uniref:Uncharacterized protein n=1 Tax=Trichostrongylus colubriformis TaxID=6319 RepID=A0AAN8G8Q7_TRICO